MERREPTKKKSEPALAPEWLKGASSGVAGSAGSSLQHSSSSKTDDHVVALPIRNWSSVTASDHDSPRSCAFVDRNSSAYFRRSLSTNGSVMYDTEPSTHSRNYSSFSRGRRDRDWDKGHDSRFMDARDRDYSDSLSSANVLTNRTKKDILRRSQSMISGKRGEVWPKRANEVKNGFHSGGSIISSIRKTAFDRDFPTLGAEEKQVVHDIGRVSSPGLSSASQSLPMGTLSVIGGDGWTSALAELPAIVGSNSTVLSSVQQTAPASLATVPPSNGTGLNMAETLAQPSLRARAVTLISVENQRLEELAIKQCRQLIPMTPSTPKNLALNSSEKTKAKVARTGDFSKVGQQTLSSQLAVNIRGSTRSDTSKASQLGKLHPLKGPRESNGVSSTAKDVSSLTNGSRPSHGALRSPSNAKLAPDLNLASSPVTQCSSMDRKPLPQVQNRIDFFNSLRRKSIVNHSAADFDSSSALSSVPEKSDGKIVANDTPASFPASESDCSADKGTDVAGNGDSCEESTISADDGDQNSVSDVVVIPEEEEAAFLRRLGWEEDATYEALTEEEISAFFNEHKEKRPASNLCQRMQQSKIVPLGSHMGTIGGASRLSSSNSASEA